MIALESSRWRLWLDPRCGVQWLAAEVRRDDGSWRAVTPDCRAGGSGVGQAREAPLAAASFHMLPYSNRIRDGRFRFGGRTVQLGRPERHAIHGALRKLPWTVRAQDGRSIDCRIDSREHPAVDWPWPIVATLDVRLEDSSLASAMTLENAGGSPMPAGLGWHPYFVREIDGVGPELELPVDAVFPDEDGDCLPDGAAVPLPPALDFRTPRALAADQRIDCCLAGFDGSARIRWADAGIALALEASAVCRHLVLYNPDMPHFAVEPVTNANDAFNLAEAGIEANRIVLAPGERLAAEMRLELL